MTTVPLPEEGQLVNETISLGERANMAMTKAEAAIMKPRRIFFQRFFGVNDYSITGIPHNSKKLSQKQVQQLAVQLLLIGLIAHGGIHPGLFVHNALVVREVVESDKYSLVPLLPQTRRYLGRPGACPGIPGAGKTNSAVAATSRTGAGARPTSEPPAGQLAAGAAAQ